MIRPKDSTHVKVLPGFYERDNLRSRFHAVPTFDFSGSMAAHAPRLPGAYDRMVTALARNPSERLQIELACCAFDTDVVFQDYAPLPFYLEEPLSFTGGGATALGAALLTVLHFTRQRRRMLESDGIHCRPALCPVVTDGCATDPDTFDEAIREIRIAEQDQEMQFVFLAPDADSVPRLRSVFGREPILLDEVNFDRLFAGLTRSLSSYSRSQIGHEPDFRRLLESDLRSASDETR